MPTVPIRIASPEIDLSGRFQSTQTVVASPAAATETIIASLTLADFGSLAVVNGIRLHGWAAYLVGTSGTAVTFAIKQTNASGSAVAATGALNVTAADVRFGEVVGKDAAPGVVTYVLTMTVTNGAAESTVSAVHLGAIVI